MKTRNQTVYDLPTRLFHWLFAGLFVFAFLIAKNVDDDSPTYAYHMLAGLLLVFVVLLRVLWGFIGSKHAKFSSFALHPQDVLHYFKGILTGERKKWPGHNPASSWAALFMMACGLGLGVTGFLMTTGSKEAFEDIHEILANSFLVIVLLHIVGVILHSMTYKDAIGLSMVDGAKSDVPSKEVIDHSYVKAGLIFIIAALSFALYLSRNFDSQNQKLNLFGTVMQLGESEGQEGDEHKEDAD